MRRSIIFLIILSIFIVLIGLYNIPLSTPVKLTLDAVKIDDEGNSLGTVQIVMSGAKLEYFFKPSRIDVYIHPFDGVVGIKPVDNTQGQIEAFPRRDFLFAKYYGTDEITGDTVFCELGFSKDMQQWIIRNNSKHVSYVCSADGAYTAQELIQYFNGLT